MKNLLDAFWRAAAYCLHPRVIALSILPLVLMVVLAWGLGYVFWDMAVDWVRAGLDASSLVNTVLGWLQSAGAARLKSAIAPLLVIFAVTPVLVIIALLVVAMLMTPAMVSLVGQRRFAQLERKQGGSFWGSLLWSLGSTLLALLAMVLSMLLWLVPPLILILPPLIWGWLTYRVLSFDALAEHASREERRALMKRHRSTLLVMGVISGFLGAAPSLLWVSAAVVAAAFVVLLPVAVWIYTLVFAFSSLWFAHYCLAALEQLRAENTASKMAVTPADTAYAAINSVANTVTDAATGAAPVETSPALPHGATAPPPPPAPSTPPHV